MPRATTRPIIMLCLSISATSRAMMVPVRYVHDWLLEGRLVSKQIGTMKRIPVAGPGGIQELIASLPNTRKVQSHGF